MPGAGPPKCWPEGPEELYTCAAECVPMLPQSVPECASEDLWFLDGFLFVAQSFFNSFSCFGVFPDPHNNAENKAMAKPWLSHRKAMAKPWQSHGKAIA